MALPRRPRSLALSLLALLSAGALAAPVLSAPAAAAPAREAAAVRLELPAGFQPEGIATDRRGRYAFTGSRVDGDVARVDLRTGAVAVLAQGPGTPSLGMEVDRRDRLFVAGGTGGDARVLDARTGALLRSWRLVPAGAPAFVNDVVLTDDAAWVTDSRSAQLFELPLGPRGRLPQQRDVRRVPLTGSWTQGASTSANGIAATPDGKALLVVNSSNGALYRVNPATGRSVLVDLGGAVLTNGDGLLLEGRRLWVVQNRLDVLTALRVAPDGRSARVVARRTDPLLDVPSTVARAGGRLLLPTARFTTTPTATTPYWITALAVPVPRSSRR